MKRLILILFYFIVTWHMDGAKRRWQTSDYSEMRAFVEKLKVDGAEKITVCLKAGSRPSDICLDPFMGSGTVGMVAKRLQRQYVGIELNQKYVEMAEKRIMAEQEPLLVEK